MKPFCIAAVVIVATSCGGTDADFDAEGVGFELRTVANCPAGYNIVEGTDADDNLRGTSGNDYILGYDGDDTIRRPQGDYYLVGRSGADVIYGNSGNDFIHGAPVTWNE